MSHIRHFEQCSMQYGDKYVPAVALKCPKCGAVKKQPMGHQKFGRDEAKDARRYAGQFERAGWHIGKRPDGDRCPSCLAKLGVVREPQKPCEVARPALLIPEKKEKPMQQPQAREVQAVRTMSREDGRLIYDKIGEVYVDEKTGYQPGWSDQRVAKDLGVHVPRAWVKQVREQFFGPEGSNPEITALVADAKKHLEDAALVVTRLGREADEIKHQGELIQRRIDNLEKTVRG